MVTLAVVYEFVLKSMPWITILCQQRPIWATYLSVLLHKSLKLSIKSWDPNAEHLWTTREHEHLFKVDEAITF